MENNKESKRANKSLLISALITMLLLLACLVWLVFYYYVTRQLKDKVPGIERFTNPFNMGYLVEIAMIVSMALTLIISFKHNTRFRVHGIVLASLGTLCFFLILFKGIVVHEVYNEYYKGPWAYHREFTMLNMAMLINLIFYLTGLWIMVRIVLGIKSVPWKSEMLTDEVVFEITQYLGIVCGITGTAFAIYVFNFLENHSHWMTIGSIRWVYSCCLIFILPYISAILYWVFKLAFKKNRSLYDEKQHHDLSTAGLVTWLLSIPMMSAFLFINIQHNSPASGVMVFPLYVFTTLIIFSATVLFNFKRA